MHLLRYTAIAALLAALGGDLKTVDRDNGPGAPVGIGDFRGYLVKLRSPSSTDTVSVMTASVLGGRWVAIRSGIPLEYRLVPMVATTARSAPLPPAAWETVHRLRRLPEIERAEPVFDQIMFLQSDPPRIAGECNPNWPGEWGPPPTDSAVNNPTWSLNGTQGANVLAAWQYIEESGRAPGTGVAVGHPDTGYLEHPSIKEALLGRGFDFFEFASDAVDQSEKGRLQWPGHGTRTASVIVGRRDFSLFPEDPSSIRISGVAPNAQLMPLRVANRVVLLDRISWDMGNLALAIHAAAIGDPNFVHRRADVISLSLGGAPSRSVLDALRVAKARDAIVLAAAGNRVPGREVVFPARYEETIAVAASTVRSKPWVGTSGGDSVVISAPGESVWVASRKQRRSEIYDCVQTATGTSYAVATTAGVAALWLSYYTDELAQLGSRAQTFEALARATARPVDGWKTAQHGPGILDAQALLAHWPPPKEVLDADRIPCDDLEALSALLPAPGRSTAHDLLFGRSPLRPWGCSEGIGHLGDELAFLFVTDPGAAAALAVFRQSFDKTRALPELRRMLLLRPISSTLRAKLEAVASVV